jgi:hypothetical protein
VVEIVPIFATPFAHAALPGAQQLNPALAALLRARATEDYRDRAVPGDPRCFRGREDLFDWSDPPVPSLRQAMLGEICSAVMAANLYPESEFDALGVQARARWVMLRPDGYLPAATLPMASWCAVYCVTAPPAAARGDSGALRLYAIRHSTVFMDAANWRLRAPFGTTHQLWHPVAGEMVVFPASLLHEIALNRAEGDLLLVIARVRFAHPGQTASPPW